jgi:hypothetical protein
MSTTLRRSARIAAKSIKTETKPVVQLLPAFVSPVVKPVTCVTDCRCVNCISRRKIDIVNRLQSIYTISSKSPSPDVLDKCHVTTKVYTIVDQNFDFINSSDFDPSRRFITTVESKCGELMSQLETEFSRGKVDEDTYFATRQILAKVYKKFALLNSK